jgi:alanyl-tRNA synthetase
MRRVSSITEDVRAEAQAFVSSGPSIFVAIAESPSAILMAASKDSGINCGEVLKRLLAPSGGRGGGSATMAQGSLPSSAALQELAEILSRELNFPA